MKNLTLINNEWKQRVNPNIAPEERAILENRNESNIEEVQSLTESIKERSFTSVSLEDATTAENIYNQHKLEGANLISVDITLPQGTGIINCRVGGEHKQIRF